MKAFWRNNPTPGHLCGVSEKHTRDTIELFYYMFCESTNLFQQIWQKVSNTMRSLMQIPLQNQRRAKPWRHVTPDIHPHSHHPVSK